MPNKALPAKIKAAGADSDAPGTFTAIVAAYNTDSGGDKIVPGAFGKSLASWEESGNRIPVVWSHQHNDAFSYIGEVLEASETEDGLVIKGQLDIDENTYAAQVYRLIKGGRINNYSFAYEVKDAEPAPKDDSDGAQTLLKELTLIEAGPTLVGMNRETRTLDVKSSGPKEKAVAGSYEALQEALTDTLTAQVGGTDGYAWPVATYSDHVVYRMYGSSPADGCETYSAPYIMNEDGSISLGDAVEVEITETVSTAPKSTVSESKVGRSLSAANEARLRQALETLQSVLGATDADEAAASDLDGKSADKESEEEAQTSGPVTTDDDPDANTDDESVDELAGKSTGTHTRVPADDAFDPEYEAALLVALDPS